MCNCLNMCRLPDVETQDGKYPVPKHSPACEDYKTEKFVVTEFDGSRCIMEPNDAMDFLDDSKYDENAPQYKHEDIYLTRDQFEALPEFQGF